MLIGACGRGFGRRQEGSSICATRPSPASSTRGAPIPTVGSVGAGTTSSSNGQLFRAAATVRRAYDNAHYNGDPGGKSHTWISDQHGHFCILPDRRDRKRGGLCSRRLNGHESPLEGEEHYGDASGANDHVSSVFRVLGTRFAPRLRDLMDWRLYVFEDADAYVLLKRYTAISACVAA